MQLTFAKVLGFNLLLTLAVGILALFADQHVSSFMFTSGITALVLAGLNLAIGLMLMLIQRMEPGKMFLASSGVLMLVGISTCFGGFATMNTGHF